VFSGSLSGAPLLPPMAVPYLKFLFFLFNFIFIIYLKFLLFVLLFLSWIIFIKITAGLLLVPPNLYILLIVLFLRRG
jgi:hypothetical protein